MSGGFDNFMQGLMSSKKAAAGALRFLRDPAPRNGPARLGAVLTARWASLSGKWWMSVAVDLMLASVFGAGRLQMSRISACERVCLYPNQRDDYNGTHTSPRQARKMGIFLEDRKSGFSMLLDQDRSFLQSLLFSCSSARVQGPSFFYHRCEACFTQIPDSGQPAPFVRITPRAPARTRWSRGRPAGIFIAVVRGIIQYGS